MSAGVAEVEQGRRAPERHDLGGGTAGARARGRGAARRWLRRLREHGLSSAGAS